MHSEDGSNDGLLPRGAPPRRKVAATGGGGYRRPKPGFKKPAKRGGSTGTGFSPMSVMLLVLSIALLVAMGLVLKPSPNLRKIEGYPAPLINDNPRNLLAEVQALLKPDVAGKTLTFTEAELNRYLNDRIRGKQGGFVSAFSKFRGVYVDLRPEYVEVYIIRSAFGFPSSISTRIYLKKAQYTSFWAAQGGSIGSIELSDRQFQPILDAFLRLQGIMGDEIEALRAIGEPSIEFGDNQITLKK